MNSVDDRDRLSACAWILSFSPRGRVAIGEFELVHILDRAPRRFGIPGTPAHCREAILWQEEVLPYVDLRKLAPAEDADTPESSGETRSADGEVVAVVGYHAFSKELPQYGALRLRAIPTRVLVTNNSACDLPDDIGELHRMACSCFRHSDFGPVPVLDLPRMFAPNRPIES